MSQENSKAVFHAVYPNGKVDMSQIEVTGDYVVATCKLYESRDSSEKEYLVAESGIAEREQGESLSSCVIAAKNMAYEGAVARVVTGVNSSITQDSAIRETDSPAPRPIREPEAARQSAPKKDTAEPVKTAPADSSKPSQEETDLPVAPKEPENSSVQKVDLLTPSSLFGDGDAEEEAKKPKPEAQDDRLQQARAVNITILGKYHDCYNWTAGEILDKDPRVIVEFAPKYNGPKEEEKEALMALYPEALRRYKTKKVA